MTQEAGVPGDLYDWIQRKIDAAVAKLARSGMLRNASISEGGLTIKGGFLRLTYGLFNILYVGPITPSLPDGTPQMGIRMRRADGTVALEIRDAFPAADGTLSQALSWYDRAGNAVFADDTDAGQGIARPWLDYTPHRPRYGDWQTFTMATTDVWETVLAYSIVKQAPRLEVCVLASMDTAATTGELRVMVGGVQLGSTTSLTFAQGPSVFGPGQVAGAHMSTLTVEVQARRTTATGGIKLEHKYARSCQS